MLLLLVWQSIEEMLGGRDEEIDLGVNRAMVSVDMNSDGVLSQREMQSFHASIGVWFTHACIMHAYICRLEWLECAVSVQPRFRSTALCVLHRWAANEL